MNNRNYNSLNTSSYNNIYNTFQQSPDLEEQYNNALINAMNEVNSNSCGYGIQYYDPSLGQSYRNGYANNEYWDVVSSYTFKMKPGKKPSEAVKAFFTGLTVADCGNVINACQLAALLKVLGADKFDAIFSNPNQPLMITEGISGQSSSYDNAASHFVYPENLSGSYLGQIGNRPIKKGQMCQIQGILPDYDVKHPGGFGRLYNVICVGKNEEGKDLFTGFGGPFRRYRALTEEQFIMDLTNEYNAPRSSNDMSIIQASGNPYNFDLNMHGMKETLTTEEGFSKAVGFAPMRVTPAYAEMRKYQNMQTPNRTASNYDNVRDSRYSSVEPGVRRSTPSPYESNTPASNVYYPEERHRVRNFINRVGNFFHHRSNENAYQPEEVHTHRRFFR